MIRKAVFSYFNPDESFGNRCGFMRYSDFLFTTALSVLCASRHFREVQFISSSWGVDVISELKLPITSYSTKLDEMKAVPREFWAYGKLLAYCEQTKPFVHIDNDVMLWDPLAPRLLNARMCFQSYEPFDADGYQYYNMLKKCWGRAPVKPKAILENPVDDFAYNCGIIGANDLSIFEEWRQCSAEYIFAQENQNLFFNEERDMLIHQNLFHEQYFLASLIKKHDWRDEVKVINVDAMEAGSDPKRRYTHLWGTLKQNKAYIAMVWMRMHDDFRETFDIIDKFCAKNKI